MACGRQCAWGQQQGKGTVQQGQVRLQRHIASSGSSGGGSGGGTTDSGSRCLWCSSSGASPRDAGVRGAVGGFGPGVGVLPVVQQHLRAVLAIIEFSKLLID